MFIRVGLIFFLPMGIWLFSQDLHFSNYSSFPFMLSPSLTGFFEEDIRVGAGYRQQWRVVPVNYQTMSAWGDMNFRTLMKDEKKYFSAGIQFFNDRAGDLLYGSTQFIAPFAFHFKSDSGYHFSLGTGLGILQTGFDPSRMTTDSQFDGYQYNSQLPAREQFQYSSYYSLLWNFGTGLLVTRFKNQKFSFHIAIHQPHNPRVSFQQGNLNYVDPRFTTVAGYTFQPLTRPELRWQAECLVQQQGKYREWIPKVGMQYFIRPLHNQSFLIHLSSRLKDAFILHGGYTYKSWWAGISYDVNLSRFRAATSGLGGLEFFIVKTFRQTYTPLIRKKTCPVFL